MQVNNKTVVVTGGANGIGRELVLNLLSKGAKVAAVDINEAYLQETKVLAGNRADQLSIHVIDISNQEAVMKFPDEIIQRHGQVDAIINNAGIIQPFIRVNDLNFTTIEKVMQVNFYGSLYMIKAFLPHLLKRPEAHIVSISSMGGFLPVPGQSIYGASKAAVKLLTEGLYAELLHTKVNVSLVYPGAIGTNIVANSGALNKQLEEASKNSKIKPLAASDAASIIINGMENNKPRILVGKDAKFMDWLYRWSPIFATKLIVKQMKNLLPQ
jgi:short-subunit dehydrogenase